MRIGIVCYPTYGGSGAVATELGRMLALRGHAVHLISPGRPFRFGLGNYQENFSLHEIASVQYPVLGSELLTLSAAVKMAQLVKEEHLDILHSHYAVPHAVSAMLARNLCGESKVKLVTTLHGTDITLVGRNPAFAPVVEMGINHSDAVVSVSNWLCGQTNKNFQIERPCHVIYNFVDNTLYRPIEHGCRCSRNCFAPNGEKILLHISNFRAVKRVEDVIRIFHRIAQETSAVLLMVGEGPDHAKAISLAQSLGVADKVRFLGLQSDVASLLGIGDLFLFPSEYESFGLAVLEAMACEVPVVCTNGGGLPEVMVQGETGYLCQVGDIEEMARRAIEILSDKKKSTRMGRAARQRAIANFSPDKIVKQYEDLYEALISGVTGKRAHKQCG